MGAASQEPTPPATPLAAGQAAAAPGDLERGCSWPWSAPAGAVSFQPAAQPPPADPSLVRRALQALEEQDGAVSGGVRSGLLAAPTYRMQGLGGVPGPKAGCSGIWARWAHDGPTPMQSVHHHGGPAPHCAVMLKSCIPRAARSRRWTCCAGILEVLHSSLVPLATGPQASPAGDVPSIQELIDISLGLGLDLRTAAGSVAELSLLPPAGAPSAPACRQLAS